MKIYEKSKSRFYGIVKKILKLIDKMSLDLTLASNWIFFHFVAVTTNEGERNCWLFDVEDKSMEENERESDDNRRFLSFIMKCI